MVGIYQRLFGRAGEKVFGVVSQELVERVGRGDENCHSRVISAARSTRLLPGGGDGAGIADEQRCLQTADINTQFKGIGGNYHSDASVTQAFFDFAALGREITGTITANCLPYSSISSGNG